MDPRDQTLLGRTLKLSAPCWLYWASMGIMEKKMETTIVYWGYSGNNGKENGNYYRVLKGEWGSEYKYHGGGIHGDHIGIHSRTLP